MTKGASTGSDSSRNAAGKGSARVLGAGRTQGLPTRYPRGWKDGLEAAAGDIYVLRTTLDDWLAVLSLVTAPSYFATVDGAAASSVSVDVLALLAHPGVHRLSFRVGRVDVNCHFFSEKEIEFDFVPNGLTEEDLNGLLTFMSSLGRLTGKLVVMTPENGPTHPIFSCDPHPGSVDYVPPDWGSHADAGRSTAGGAR